MNHFFSANDSFESSQFNEKISLDELYDRKREVEIQRMNIYRTILNRVHTKIKIVSRQKCETQLFYVIPEFIFGVPKYNVNTCISFIIEKLEDNGFHVKYTHPNLLFISWGHYIPSYKREQIKKETGITIDGFGAVIQKNKEVTHTQALKDTIEPNALLLQTNTKTNSSTGSKKDFKDVQQYKPTGIYNLDLLKKIKDKTS